MKQSSLIALEAAFNQLLPAGHLNERNAPFCQEKCQPPKPAKGKTRLACILLTGFYFLQKTENDIPP